jgi:hypothetical protein
MNRRTRTRVEEVMMGLVRRRAMKMLTMRKMQRKTERKTETTRKVMMKASTA